MKTKQISKYFESCLYFSMSKMHRQINSMAELSFKKIDMAPSYAFLLMSLNENDKLSCGEISEIIGICPSTTTRFVDKLIEKGFCKRKFIGRNSYVSITKKGKDVLPEIDDCWKDLCDMVVSNYNRDSVKKLNDLIVDMNSEANNTKCYCDK